MSWFEEHSSDASRHALAGPATSNFDFFAQEPSGLPMGVDEYNFVMLTGRRREDYGRVGPDEAAGRKRARDASEGEARGAPAAVSDDKFVVKRLKTDKHSIPPLPGAEWVGQHPFRYMISGASGTGKTTLAITLLNNFYIDYFDEIWIWSPNFELDDTWRNLRAPPTYVFSEFREEQLDRLHAQQRGARSRATDARGRPLKTARLTNTTTKRKKVLCIFDDFITQRDVMEHPKFKANFTLGRHENISTMVLTQKYNAVPKVVRTNCTMLSVFETENAAELQSITDEHSGGLLAPREFRRLFNDVTRERWSFLTVKADANPLKRFRRGLREVMPLASYLADTSAERRQITSAHFEELLANGD